MPIDSEGMSQAQMEFEQGFVDFIQRNESHFIFAKTYARFCPHEYIVKKRLPAEDARAFEIIAEKIRKYGWNATYGKGKPPLPVRQYYAVGDWYYWTMGDPIPETEVLNRAKFTDYNFEIRDSGIIHITYKGRG